MTPQIALKNLLDHAKLASVDILGTAYISIPDLENGILTYIKNLDIGDKVNEGKQSYTYKGFDVVIERLDDDHLSQYAKRKIDEDTYTEIEITSKAPVINSYIDMYE